MKTLTSGQFSDFFRSLHGHEPFPWQQRLVDELFTDGGRWPDLLNLPTASGKTSTVEIALYSLAAGLPVPRRIVFVVDRRVIVQQASIHASHILDKLTADDPPPILKDVRQALINLHAVADETPPFLVAELRGGIEQNNQWADRPDIPAIITSTVDQVGSRLLYRGYGVSDRMKPVHAGLMGNDALILLDEVHLARPFARLLSTIRNRFRPQESPIPERWQVAELSATPGAESTRMFGLSSADLSHPVLARRLNAPKPVKAATVKLPADSTRHPAILAQSHAAHAQDLLRQPAVQTLAIIVNRVQLAADIYRRMAEAVDTDTKVVLLTGRMRGLDRDHALDLINRRASSGQRSDSDGRIVVVATQTIEAGADFDFDAIVTDCASIDALIQRFGRVDRIGSLDARLEGAERPVSVIVGSPRLTTVPDPVYGEALGHTWNWLIDQSELDFSPIKIDELRASGALTDSLSVQSPPTMRLLSSHLDRLVRTSPIPDGDVNVDHLLHGLDHQANQEVDVVWRADIDRALLDARKHTDSDIGLASLMDALPPMPGEAMSVPIAQLTDWLRDSDNDEMTRQMLSDAESQLASPSITRRRLRPFMIVRGPDTLVSSAGSDIRPGDTIVVPADYGGISAGSWAPRDSSAVEDLCELAGLTDGTFRVRLNPDILAPSAEAVARGDTSAAADALSDPAAEKQQYAVRRAQLLGSIREASNFIPSPEWVAAHDKVPAEELRAFLTSRWALRPPRHPSPHNEGRKQWERDVRTRAQGIDEVDQPPGLSESRAVRSILSRFRFASDTPELIDVYAVIWSQSGRKATTGRGSARGGKYPLHSHLVDVERWARQVAKAVGLKPDLAEELSTAARLHDLGKADPRFQLYLHEGRLDDAQMLAKSAIPWGDAKRDRQARLQSGYPRKLRHEAASVALIPDETETTRYLIASHHGFARPFYPPQITERTAISMSGELSDTSTPDAYGHATVGGGSADDFARAVERFGYFGIGWLEALLRLADHAASRKAQRPKKDAR